MPWDGTSKARPTAPNQGVARVRRGRVRAPEIKAKNISLRSMERARLWKTPSAGSLRHGPNALWAPYGAPALRSLGTGELGGVGSLDKGSGGKEG